MPEAGLKPGTIRSNVHCLIHYATKEDTLNLMKKLKVYNCKGDKSIPPHALRSCQLGFKVTTVLGFRTLVALNFQIPNGESA